MYYNHCPTMRLDAVLGLRLGRSAAQRTGWFGFVSWRRRWRKRTSPALTVRINGDTSRLWLRDTRVIEEGANNVYDIGQDFVQASPRRVVCRQSLQCPLLHYGWGRGGASGVVCVSGVLARTGRPGNPPPASGQSHLDKPHCRFQPLDHGKEPFAPLATCCTCGLPALPCPALLLLARSLDPTKDPPPASTFVARRR